MPGIRVENLWKKFHRGEMHDSLRDFIPAMLRRALPGKRGRPTLSEGDFWALREVSFEVQAGKAIGIVGPNGAGKSTLLKVLSRILRPTRGQVRVDGRMGTLIEVAAGFHPDLTGRENIYLQGAILGMRRSEIARKFDAIVDFSEIESFIDTPVKRYSSGMNARLGFSIATSLEQEVLLVDEVLSVGDWNFQQKCSRRMLELVKSGAAVIFVSHNHRAVCELCDDALLLYHGQVLDRGPAESVVRKYLSGHARSTATADAAVRIAWVRLTDGAGAERWEFDPGEEAQVEIELTAQQDAEQLTVLLFLRDFTGYVAFNTSTVRLGAPGISMKAGETRRVRFDLTLHLARGQYGVGVSVVRYTTTQSLDSLYPAASIVIQEENRVGGIAHLNPRVS